MNIQRRTAFRSFKTQAMALMVITLMLLAALQVTPAHALNITSNPGAGNWNSTGTWSGGVVPGPLDTVTIASGSTVTVTADATAAALTFATASANSTVAINSGVTLTITGAVIIRRGSSPSATSTLALGAGNLSAGSISFTSPLGTETGGHAVTLSTGTATVAGNIEGLSSGSAAISITGAGTLQVGGAMFTSATGTLTTSAGSTVEYNGNGTQGVGNFAYSNLTLSGSGAKSLPLTATIGGNLTLAGTASSTAPGKKTIGGNLVIGAGTEFDTSASNTATLTVTGTTSVGGTLKLYSTAAKTFTGNVVINSGGVWSEQAAAAFTFGGSLQNDGSFTASTGLHTFNGTGKTISGANPVAIPNVVLNSGASLTNNGTLTVATSLSGTGALTNGATGVLNFGGPSIAPTLNASAAGNLVSYSGGAQTVFATAYDQLVLRGSGVKSILAGTSVATNLSVAPAGTASASIAAGQTIPTGSLLLGGTLQVSGTWGGTGSGAAHVNPTYFAATTGKLNVSGLSVNVTANPQTKTYGDADPAFTYISSNPSVVFTGSLSRVSGEDAGNYAITIGTLNAGYYSMNFTPANLTINKKALTQGTVDNKSIAPGSADPVFTVTYSGLVGSDTFASINTPPTCGVSGPHTAPGDYPITCTDGSGSDNDYDLSGVHYTSGTLHVTNATFGASPTSWNFGLVKVGVTSTSKNFLILNTGSADMQVNTVALGGLNPKQFQITADGCTGATVHGSGFCTVSVAFKPTAPGTKSAAIQVTDTTPGSPHSIPLTGRGEAEVSLNGGFNLYPTSVSKVPSQWVAANFGSNDGKNVFFKTEGTASVRIGNTAAVSKTLTQTRLLSGVAGSVFQLSVWAKGQAIPVAGPAVRVVVSLYNGAALVQMATLNLPNGTYIFTQHNLTFAASGAYNKVVIQLVYAKGSGAAWFDGLSLLRAP